jgi:hypothetical protein
MKHVYATLALWHALAVIPAIASGPERPNEGKPRSLNKGIHLLLDDHFIAHSSGVERKVISPRRSLSKAVVTGAVEHQNWQPFFTVLHDGVANVKKRPFRMWYNADVVDDPADGAFFGKSAYLDSPDGAPCPGRQ